jgi:amino acid transporter
VFAFARDGGLPKPLRTVSRSYRSPVGGIWAAALLTVAVCFFSSRFSVLVAGCAVFLYISYAMPVAAGLFAEGRTWTSFGPFRLGALSKPFAAITVAGVVVLFLIGVQPPNDQLLWYAGGLFVLLVALWFASERRRFAGPPVGAEIERRQALLLAEEQAVGELAPAE